MLAVMCLQSQVVRLRLAEGILSEGVIMPEFKGGEAELNNFVLERLLFPGDDSTSPFEVEVGFTVDKSGKVKDVKVLEGKDKMAINIAETIVLKMPKWKAGVIEGQPASIPCSLTIVFDPATLSAHQKTNSQSLTLAQSSSSKMPEFPGGANSLRKYIQEKVKYPESARKSMISGRVTVSFIIDSKGKVRYPMVYRSLSPELDEEAIWVVSRMPRWDLPKDNIGCWMMSIPIDFRP